jgi:ATP-dependent Clp protease ATP-binding subunit ClpA
LASALGPEALIKIDCSEYTESHQIARLTGAPAGYVGFGAPTILERKLDKDKLQVLLFDEFEKANPTLANLLLAMLEDGVITTSADETLILRNCIILLTSNLGAKKIQQGPVGFGSIDDKAGSLLNFVRKELPVEFVNRLTDIVFFQSLTSEEQERVAILELEKLRQNVQHLVRLTWTSDAPKGVVGKVAIGKEKGGRSIRKYVDRIHADIAEQLLSGKIQQGMEFKAG